MSGARFFRFRKPLDAEEERARFLLIEDRQERMLVVSTVALADKNMALKPTEVYPTADLEEIFE